MPIPESVCPGHELYRRDNWKLCRKCDYLEPVGMFYLPEED